MQTPTRIDLNPPQQQVVERGLLTSGFNCIIQMPTGAGKTWLAEQAILATLRNDQRAVYLTPLRALANELVDKWKRLFDGFEVGVFTGEYGQHQAYPVPFDRARLLVMTPERLDACTRHWRSHWGWLPEVGLLVVDELHLLGDPGRGPRLEGAILRARRLNPFLQLLGLSATLGNRGELAEWLAGVHFVSDWRPIPVAWRCTRYQRATDKPRILHEEVDRCIAAGGQSLVFVQSRRRAEALASGLAKLGLAAGHHHAGLDSNERTRLEQEFRSGHLRVLVSTGTLEMGLNLPARQVVLYDLQTFDGSDFVPLSTNTVWQRAGRAGRRGLDTQGEVVLLAPSWDRTADQYARGQFDRVLSGLSDQAALSEQLLADVSSGLARTRSQLKRAFQMSLAAHQHRLPPVDQTINEMVAAGMMIESNEEGSRNTVVLKATRLGRIAVRQMLAPSTVVSLAKAFRSSPDGAEPVLTFLDILLICGQTKDCEPLIPVDFEELEDLSSKLAREYSTLLSGDHSAVTARFHVSGRRLLAVIKTALVARQWTRSGDPDGTAETFGCYAFEVRRLAESFERLLTAASSVVSPTKDNNRDSDDEYLRALLDEGPPLHERMKALTSMVANGLDEQTVTLTFVSGLGPKLASRLRDAGITDIEALALAEPDELGKLRGVSRCRAVRWIEEAAALIQRRSALAFREVGTKARSSTAAWPVEVNQYRLRRALDLNVRQQGEGFEVSGGLEPHRVRLEVGKLGCDCGDFAKGETCKHLLAVRLNQQDPILARLVKRLQSAACSRELDLHRLWFEGKQ